MLRARRRPLAPPPPAPPPQAPPPGEGPPPRRPVPLRERRPRLVLPGRHTVEIRINARPGGKASIVADNKNLAAAGGAEPPRAARAHPLPAPRNPPRHRAL